jgi:hypothetical protein
MACGQSKPDQIPADLSQTRRFDVKLSPFEGRDIMAIPGHFDPALAALDTRMRPKGGLPSGERRPSLQGSIAVDRKLCRFWLRHVQACPILVLQNLAQAGKGRIDRAWRGFLGQECVQRRP